MSNFELNLLEELKVTTELGIPLPPFDKHAVSVSLPLWKHVVGYEEGKKDVVEAMDCGYPRFRYPNSVVSLFVILKAFNLAKSVSTEKVNVLIKGSSTLAKNDSLFLESSDIECLIHPSLAVAKRFSEFLSTDSEEIPIIEQFYIGTSGYVVSFFSKSFSVKAKRYWQHSGEILTSRVADSLISELSSSLDIISTPFNESKLKLLQNLTDRNYPQIDLQIKVSTIPTILIPVDLLVRSTKPKDISVHSTIKQRIIDIITADKSTSGIIQDDIQLTICGMASIFTALQVILNARKGLLSQEKTQIVVFGFPYLDTLKIMSRVEWVRGGVHFLGLGEAADIDKLEILLQVNQYEVNGTIQNHVAAIFTEFPTNPLMKSSDLIRLTSLANKYNVSLVADDTISNFSNTNLFNSPGVSVDILCSSLTKIFSGTGNVMAGSLILNRYSSKYELLKSSLSELNSKDFIPHLSELDANILEINSRSFLFRSLRINKNAFDLANWLASHPSVKIVYYPGLNGGNPVYNSVIRSNRVILEEEISLNTFPSLNAHEYNPGYGCLLSIELHDHLDTQKFYDDIHVNKGPSLGTNFTLVSPYTLLAHYMELDWAAEFGVNKNLIRISVGLENIEELKETFSVTFNSL